MALTKTLIAMSLLLHVLSCHPPAHTSAVVSQVGEGPQQTAIPPMASPPTREHSYADDPVALGQPMPAEPSEDPQLQAATKEFVEEIHRAGLKIPDPSEYGKKELLLSIVPPRWDANSETVETFGSLLHTSFKEALAGIKERRFRWVDVRKEPWDVEISLTVAPAPGSAGQPMCTTFVRYRNRKKPGLLPIHEFRFDPRIFGVTSCTPPPETFLSDGMTGLKNGAQEGDKGLSVSVDLIGQKTPSVLCEGTEFQLVVDVIRGPAWIRIYSLAEDGTAMQDWASEAPISNRWFTDPAIPIRLPRNARYRVLAVAVPDPPGRNGFGKAGPPAGCLAGPGTGFSARLLPKEAAVATLTYRVVPSGADPCPRDADADAMAAKIKAALKKLPLCGE